MLQVWEGRILTTIIWNAFACIGIAFTMLALFAWIHMWIVQQDEGLSYDEQGRQIDYCKRHG